MGYADYCHIYTDGSKAGERVASAIVYKGITKSVQLPELTSIFRAELYPLFLAIYVIRRSKLKKIDNFRRFAIFFFLLRQKAATYATYTEKLQIQIKTHKIHTKADKTTNMLPLML